MHKTALPVAGESRLTWFEGTGKSRTSAMAKAKREARRSARTNLATVLGLRDVRTTTPYGRGRYQPLPTWNTPTGLGDRISRVMPPRVPALHRRDLQC